MKKVATLVLLFLAFVSVTEAQKVDVGLFGGASNYSGDLTKHNSIFISETKPAVGGIMRINPNPYLDFRIGVSSAYISGSDLNFTDQTLRNQNLSFRSNIVELSAVAEFNILGFDIDIDNFSPYIFGGVAGFYHNPQALYQAQWVDLQPLGTEGQGTTAYPDRKKYSLYQFSIPFGLGAKVNLGSGLTLALDLGLRKTFTDYLDDVSTTYVDQNTLILENGELAYKLSNRSGQEPGTQFKEYPDGYPRGNPKYKDWYMMAGFSLTYRIGVAMGGSNKSGCPANW